MRSGPLIAGGILLAFGAIVFLWSTNQMSVAQTSLGTLGRMLSSNLQAQYQELQMIQMIGGGFGIAGIVVLIYGAAARPVLKPSI